MVGRGRLLKCSQVATDAFGGQSLTIELSNGAGPVARIAVNGGVRANQGKTILMLTDGVDRDLPSALPVAEVALRAILPPVQIGVAILAILPNVGEDRVDVAILASHSRVQAPQRVTSLVVIKLRSGANRFPGRRRMATLTSNLHRTVWTAHGRTGGGALAGRRTGSHLEQ